jgi:hypothetical protein
VAPPAQATPTSTPLPGPWTCSRSGYLGSPHGLPDFDMRQARVSLPDLAPLAQETGSGVAAFANALWYLDAQAETVLGTPFNLVSGLVGWDDHSPENVPAMLTTLAGELDGGAAGVSVEGAVYGLDSYLAAQHTLGAFDIETVRSPTVAWLEDRAKNVEGVALVLLGFYQEPAVAPASRLPVRFGGHWVAVCCVERQGAYIELADPWFDAAARGAAGRSWGGVPDNALAHNDTANASYDRYTLASGDAGFVPLGYGGLSLNDISEASVGQNFAAELEAYRGNYDPLLPIQVAADYAVLIRPAAGYPIYEPSPTPTATISATPTATVLPTDEATATPTSEGTATEEWTPTPTPTATSGNVTAPELFAVGLPIIAK